MTTLQDKKIEFKFQDYDDSEKSEHSKQILTTWQDIGKHNRVSHACDSCQLFLNETKHLSIKDKQNILVMLMAIFSDCSAKGDMATIVSICQDKISQLFFEKISIQYQTIFYRQLVLLFMRHHDYDHALHYAFSGLHCVHKKLDEETKETDQVDEKVEKAVEIDLTDTIKTFKDLINQINFKFIYAHLQPFLDKQIDDFHEKIVLLDQQTEEVLERVNKKDRYYGDFLPNIVNSTLKYMGTGLINFGLLDNKLIDIYKTLDDDFNYHLEQLAGTLIGIRSFDEYEREIQVLLTFIEVLVNHQQYFLARQYCNKVTENLNKRDALKEKDDKTEQINMLKDTVLKMSNLASEYERGEKPPPQLVYSMHWKSNQTLFEEASHQFYEQINQGSAFFDAQAKFNNVIHQLLEKILQEIVDYLGNPPCEFTVVGIKGLSQQTLTPVSAIDVVLLVSDAAKQTDTYFQLLTKLLQWHCYLLSSAATINHRDIQLSPACLESLKNYKAIDSVQGYFDRYQSNQVPIDQLITYGLYRGLPIYKSHVESSLLEDFQSKIAKEFIQPTVSSVFRLKANQSLLQRSSCSYLKADGQLLEKPPKLTPDSLKQAIEKWCVNMGIYFGLKDRAVHGLLDELKNQKWFSAAFISSIKKIYQEISCAQLKGLLNLESSPEQSEEALLEKKGVKILNNIIKPIHQINFFLPTSFPIDPPVAIYQQMIDQYTNREEWDEKEDDDLHEKEKEAKNSQRKDNSGRDGKRENNEEGDNEAEQEEGIQGTISALVYNLAIRDGIRAKEYLNYYKLLKDKLQDYREHFRREIEKYRNEIKRSNQDDEHLLRVLKRYPNDDGRRISVEEEQTAWEASYQQLLKPFETAEKIYIKMPDGQKYHLPDDIKIQKPNDAGEYVDTELNLFNENGDINSSYKNVRRPVARFRHQTLPQIETYYFHLKQDPELPVSEYANDRLHEIVIGHGTCKTSLCGIKRPRQKKIYPALLSQTVPGVLLSDLLKNHPQGVPELDKKAFHQLVLMALLVNPEDGKPNNYRVESFINEANEAKYRIIGIDNDHAFVPPVLRGNAREYFRLKLFVKCILYCFIEMKEPIDQEARNEFLSLNLSKIIDQWRVDVKKIDASYNSIFTETEQESFIRRSDEERNSYITATFHRGAITRVYRKLYQMKQLLEDNPTITLIQLLEHLEPELISRFKQNYKTELFEENQDRTINQRFEIAKKEYGKEGETITPSKQLVSSQWGYHPTLKELKREYRAQAAFDELFIAQGKDEYRIKVKQDLEAGSTNSYRELLLDDFREKVIHMINFNQLDESQQRIIINELKMMSFVDLRLKNCKILTDKELTTILKKSPCLQKLDISGCEQLTENIIQSISSQCEQLERLTLNRLTNWKQIITTKTFKNLRKLYVNDNPNLVKIELEVPNLQLIQANGSNQLAHKSIIEKYPFLIGFTKYPYAKLAELMVSLDETLEKYSIKRADIISDQCRSIIKEMVYKLLTQLFQEWEQSVKALKRGFKNKDFSFKGQSLITLGKIGHDVNEQIKEELIVNLLNSIKKQKNVAHTFGKIACYIPEHQQINVVTALVYVIKPHGSSNSAFSAAIALDQIVEFLTEENQQNTIRVLFELSKNEDTYLFGTVMRALFKLLEIFPYESTDEIIEKIISVAEGRYGSFSEATGFKALELIGKIGGVFSTENRYKVVISLIKIINEDRLDSASLAAKSLLKIGQLLSHEMQNEIIVPLLDLLEGGKLSSGSKYAAWVLGGLGNFISLKNKKHVVTTLTRILKENSLSFDLHANIIEALGKLDQVIDEKSLEELNELFVDELFYEFDRFDYNFSTLLKISLKYFPKKNQYSIIESLIILFKKRSAPYLVRSLAASAIGKSRKILSEEDRYKIINELFKVLKDCGRDWSENLCMAISIIELDERSDENRHNLFEILVLPLIQEPFRNSPNSLEKLVRNLEQEKISPNTWSNTLAILGYNVRILSKEIQLKLLNILLMMLEEIDQDDSLLVQIIYVMDSFEHIPEKSHNKLIKSLLKIYNCKCIVRSDVLELLGSLSKTVSSEKQHEILEVMLNALKDSNSDVRGIAAKSLGRLKEVVPVDKQEEIIKRLIEMLNDNDIIVRSCAAEGLENLGETLSAKNRLKRPNPMSNNYRSVLFMGGVYATSINILGKSGEMLSNEQRGDLTKGLIELLSIDETIYDFFSETIKALGYLESCLPNEYREKVIMGLINVLLSSEKKVNIRKNAAWCIGRLHKLIPKENLSDVLSALIQALHDKESEVCAKAIQALSSFGENLSKEIHKTVIKELVKKLGDTDSAITHELIEAFKYLSTVLPEDSRREIFKQLIENLNSDIGIEAAKTLGFLCDIPQIFPILFKHRYEAYLQSTTDQQTLNINTQSNNISQKRNNLFSHPSSQTTRKTITTDLTEVETKKLHI